MYGTDFQSQNATNLTCEKTKLFFVLVTNAGLKTYIVYVMKFPFFRLLAYVQTAYFSDVKICSKIKRSRNPRHTL